MRGKSKCGEEVRPGFESHPGSLLCITGAQTQENIEVHVIFKREYVNLRVAPGTDT